MIHSSFYSCRIWRDRYALSSVEILHIEVFYVNAVLVSAGQAVSHCYGFGPTGNLRMVFQIT